MKKDNKYIINEIQKKNNSNVNPCIDEIFEYKYVNYFIKDPSNKHKEMAHREDGPAKLVFFKEKLKRMIYYQFDKLHRTDGPADIEYHDNGWVNIETYYINGKLHRIDGPAYIQYNKHGKLILFKYYLNGEYISATSDEEFKKYISVLVLK